MISRWGSQVLAEQPAFEFSGSLPLNPTPKPVITAMAGFELAFAFSHPGKVFGVGVEATGSPECVVLLQPSR
jgi:hypothetical protein